MVKFGKAMGSMSVENIVLLIVGVSLLAGFAPTLLDNFTTLVEVFLNATGLTGINASLIVGGLFLVGVIALIRKGAKSFAGESSK